MAILWLLISFILVVFGLVVLIRDRGKRYRGPAWSFAGIAVMILLFTPAVTAENDAKARLAGWSNHAEQSAATKAGVADPVAFRAQLAKAEEAAKAEAIQLEAENNEKGFHCLSQWDGNSADFIGLVKARLRDPDSFEVMETRITPKDKSGVHKIYMTYRAKNGFGGMNVETALGSVVNATCAVTFIVAE